MRSSGSAQDIIAAVKAYREKGGAFDELVLDGNTLKAFEEVFLCGTTLSEMKKQLGFDNIRVNYRGGTGLVEILATKK